MAAASTKAITIPDCPPSTRPNTSSIPVRVPSSRTVFRLFTAPPRLFFYVDLDLFRLGVFALRQVHLQHAVLVDGRDPALIDGPGKLEGPGEDPEGALDAVVVLLLGLLDELPLAAQHQHIVLD